MKKALMILFLAVLALASPAQKGLVIDPVRINSLVRELKDSFNIPGIAVGIAIGNKVKYESSFGYTDLESKTELTGSSVWQLCSISKQFAAVACFKLAEEKKLSLTDRITEYIPGLPASYNDIMVCNLLSHTSGIKDYINEKSMYGTTWEGIRENVFTDTLNFRPGDKWSYSNTGFRMAAKIVEKISGMDYNQYIERNFFRKMKMESTQRLNGGNQRPGVKGYEYRDNRYFPPEMDFSKFQGQGDGEITSTLSDLLKWNISLVHGKIIGKEMISGMWSCTKLNNGNPAEIFPGSGMNYGMGWFIKESDGRKIVWTPGSGFGFSTTSQYMPCYDLTVIVLCNKDQFLMADEIGFSIIRSIVE